MYGWGLYGSTVRSVAEGYGRADRDRKRGRRTTLKSDVLLDGKPIRDNNYARENHLGVIANLEDYGSVDAVLKNYEFFENRGKLRANERADYEWLKANRDRIALHEVGDIPQHIYEQTFFTDRAPGDESHLLKWYEPVSEEQTEWIFTSMLPGHGNEFNKAIADYIASWRSKIKAAEKDPNAKKGLAYRAEQERGEDLYRVVEEALGSPKAASEFLARAGIDGVKYPVDSYGGKGVKDGDKVGWNYVSFRDDNIRVDHKWTDGVARFSRGGVFTGSAADYANRSRRGGVDDGPSLVKIGKSNGVAFGWGLYGSTAKSDAENFGDNIYEQTFFTNRPEGDESHLIDWEKPLTEENKNRILDGLVYEARRNDNVKNAVEITLAEEARDFGLDQDKDYVPESERNSQIPITHNNQQSERRLFLCVELASSPPAATRRA